MRKPRRRERVERYRGHKIILRGFGGGWLAEMSCTVHGRTRRGTVFAPLALARRSAMRWLDRWLATASAFGLSARRNRLHAKLAAFD